MKKPLYVLCLCTCVLSQLAAQTKPRDYFILVSNNAIALPFTGTLGIFHEPLHPGFGVGMTVKHWNKNTKHLLYQTARFGLIYQQYVQTAVQVYSDFNYRFQALKGFGAGINLGVGYLHSFNDLQQFKLNAQGQYEKTGAFGRPNVMIPIGLNLGYLFTSKDNRQVRPFIEYQLWLQTPFAKAYIPILPNSALHIGISTTLKTK
jgi:hypothetical protein